jgi:hypothetical protein
MNRLPTEQPADVCILAIAKGDERFVFVFHDTQESRSEALRRIGNWASHPDLRFTWYDAAQLSQRIRRIGAGQDQVGEVDTIKTVSRSEQRKGVLARLCELLGMGRDTQSGEAGFVPNGGQDG